MFNECVNPMKTRPTSLCVTHLTLIQPSEHLTCIQPGDEADEELEEEDEDPDIGTDVVDFLIAKRSWRQVNHPNPSGTATLTDFEADSESSDFEQVQQLSRRGLPPTVGSTRRVLNLIEMPQSSNTNISSSNSLLQQRNHNIGNKMLPNKAHGKNIAVAVITPNSHGNTSHGHGLGHGLGHELNKSPLGLRKTRHHHNDTSKFNRSNRKSKNCAIFYFKHLDTDNEQGNAAGSDLQSEDDPSLIHRRRAGGDVSTVLWWRISAISARISLGHGSDISTDHRWHSFHSRGVGVTSIDGPWFLPSLPEPYPLK